VFGAIQCAEKLRANCITLAGWEVYDFQKDEHGKFIAPLKVPDLSESELKYPDSCRTEDERRQFYSNELEDSDTRNKGCGVYLDGFLYDKIDESEWYVIDENTIINTRIEQKDGSFKAGPPVSVFDCPPSHKLDPDNSLHEFGDLIAGRHAHVRIDRGSKGTMHSFGKRVYNGDLGEYAPNMSDTDSNKLARRLCQDSTKNLLDLLKILYPRELRAMQKLERDVGIFPADYMGGIDRGIVSSSHNSVNNGNPSHFDKLDASLGVATFTEKYPGMAKNVSGYLLLICS
jgi:hypothetical protein